MLRSYKTYNKLNMVYISEIIKELALEIVPQEDIPIYDVKPLYDYRSFTRNTISWVSQDNVNVIPRIGCGVLICPENIIPSGHNNVILLRVSNPRFAFLKMVSQFFDKSKEPHVSTRSIIHSSVQIGQGVLIGDNVVIEKNCIIGDKCVIGHNTVIMANSVIDDDVIIGSNCTIGGVGFGYEKDQNDSYVRVPHVGNVKLERNVEVGNNVCIDRAVLGSTVLKENVKVDNLVHIAHGVKVGRNSLIIANTMIAGSVEIGENTWVSPSSNILNKVNIGSNALVGMGALVLKNVESDTIVAGVPARVIRKVK